MNLRRRAIVLSFVLLGAAPASAYVVNKTQTGAEMRWGALPMRFDIHSAAAPGVSAATTQAAIRAAYQAWSNVSCSYYQSLDLGVVNREWGDSNDGVNTNTWLPGWPQSYAAQALAITKTYFEVYSGKINDADTHYNPNRSWATTGSLYAIDVQSVATHEIGHQLGLDHPPIPEATMYYATGNGDTKQRSLHSDDIAGVCHIYPSGQQPAPECTKPEHCTGVNETCQNGKCVPDSGTKNGYGSTCSSHSGCSTGLCLSTPTGMYCSQRCESQACPNGDRCESAQTSTGQVIQVCAPNTGDLGKLTLGQGCQHDLQCKSEICLSVPGRGYLCSQRCDQNKDNCPDGYRCAASNVGGLCIPKDEQPPTKPDDPIVPPPPPAKKDLGEPCDGNSSCQSGLCGKTPTGSFCTQLCVQDKEKVCPPGFDCLPVTGSEQGACMRLSDAAVPGSLGAKCEDHGDCQSKICAVDQNGERFCTALCDPKSSICPDRFECVEAGDKHACQPKSTIPEDDEDGDDSGCRLSPRAPAPGWLLLLLPLLLLRRRRSR